MIIVGGGVIGLELGQVYKRLGAEVTVIEYLDRIIPTMDARAFEGIDEGDEKAEGEVQSFTWSEIRRTEEGDEITIKANNKKGEEVEFKGDYCLVSVGRRPYTDGLNAEAAGVKIDDKGRVEVNEQLQTSTSNIYAIGDVIRGAYAGP